jgi:hypothetical protein
VRRQFGQIRRRLTRVAKGADEADLQQQRRTLILFWIAVVGVAITMLQFAPTGIRWTGDAGEAAIHLFVGDGEAEVSIVVESRVVNRRPEYGFIDNHRVPTRATAPQIDLYVRNEGPDTVHLTKVKIEVIEMALLETCIPPQGGGPEAPPFELSYFVNLPINPLPEERTIYRTLSQSVPPGVSGSVNLYLRTLEAESLSQLYALRLTLLSGDTAEPVDVGRYVIGLPGPVSRSGSILPEDRNAIGNLYGFDSGLESTWCYRRNMAEVSRLLALPGKRSPAMKALESMQPAPNWSTYADPRPPRAAAQALLEPPSFLDLPSLAVFAAERAGNGGFQSEIEERAVAILLRSAEEAIDFQPLQAILSARAALGFEDSPAGREILARAEAHLRGLEDVSGELTG